MLLSFCSLIFVFGPIYRTCVTWYWFPICWYLFWITNCAILVIPGHVRSTEYWIHDSVANHAQKFYTSSFTFFLYLTFVWNCKKKSISLYWKSCPLWTSQVCQIWTLWKFFLLYFSLSILCLSLFIQFTLYVAQHKLSYFQFCGKFQTILST